MTTNNDNNGSVFKAFCLVLAMLPGLGQAALTEAGDLGMTALTDEEMSSVSGQALFQTSKIVGGNTQATGTSGLTFYRVGLDVDLDLNMNIDNLELGRTGPDVWPSDPFNETTYPYGSYTPNVDFWAKNVAFGCVADADGNCVDSEIGPATQLKPLNLLRPYLEFAVANDGSKVGRNIVGIRLGAENIEGPLSFGQVRAFSGYLTAQAQLTLEGMTDVATTCGAETVGPISPNSTPSGGCPGAPGMEYWDGVRGTGVNLFAAQCVESGGAGCDNPGEISGNNTATFQPTDNRYSVQYLKSASYGTDSCNMANGQATTFNCRGSLGLDNQQESVIGINAQLAELTLDFNSRQSGVLDAVASGKRLTQAQILNPGLGSLITQVTNTIAVNQCAIRDGLIIPGDACALSGLLPGLVNALLRPVAREVFIDKACDGLNAPCTGSVDNKANILDVTPVGYNLTNFHQVQVNSNNIGLTFQRQFDGLQGIRYPGMQTAAQLEPGWSLYLPDAFFISVSEPTAIFTDNIQNGAAGRGDLVGLDPVFDNCWGAAQFC